MTADSLYTKIIIHTFKCVEGHVIVLERNIAAIVRCLRRDRLSAKQSANAILLRRLQT